MELNGQTAVITGSTGSLGRAIALSLADAGCNCICHYHTNKTLAEKIAEEIRQKGQNAIAVAADLTRTEDIENLFTAAATLGPPTILINSAAVFTRQPLDEITPEEAHQILDTNLIAPILTAQQLSRIVKNDHADSDVPIAKIINIADVGGIRPWANYTLYCASKAGLISVTKSLAKELAPAICVNAIAPGLATWPENFSEQAKHRQLQKIPMARIAHPKDISNAIVFLLKNDYITGQILNVDGGRCI